MVAEAKDANLLGSQLCVEHESRVAAPKRPFKIASHRGDQTSCELDGVSVPCSTAERLYGMRAALPPTEFAKWWHSVSGPQPQAIVVNVRADAGGDQRVQGGLDGNGGEQGGDPLHSVCVFLDWEDGMGDHADRTRRQSSHRRKNSL